jgi:hypothetical protein
MSRELRLAFIQLHKVLKQHMVHCKKEQQELEKIVEENIPELMKKSTKKDMEQFAHTLFNKTRTPNYNVIYDLAKRSTSNFGSELFTHLQAINSILTRCHAASTDIYGLLADLITHGIHIAFGSFLSSGFDPTNRVNAWVEPFRTTGGSTALAQFGQMGTNYAPVLSKFGLISAPSWPTAARDTGTALLTMTAAQKGASPIAALGIPFAVAGIRRYAVPRYESYQRRALARRAKIKPVPRLSKIKVKKLKRKRS